MRSQEGQAGAGQAEHHNVEQISSIVVDVGYALHRELGPGLFESVYEAVMAKLLRDRGLAVVRQTVLPIDFQGVHLDEGFRVDLLIEGRFVVEIKSVETLAPVHFKQLLTYLRLLRLPLGLLINFGAPTFKTGVRRIANQHHGFAASRFRVNQSGPST